MITKSRCQLLEKCSKSSTPGTRVLTTPPQPISRHTRYLTPSHRGRAPTTTLHSFDSLPAVGPLRPHLLHPLLPLPHHPAIAHPLPRCPLGDPSPDPFRLPVLCHLHTHHLPNPLPLCLPLTISNLPSPRSLPTSPDPSSQNPLFDRPPLPGPLVQLLHSRKRLQTMVHPPPTARNPNRMD